MNRRSRSRPHRTSRKDFQEQQQQQEPQQQSVSSPTFIVPDEEDNDKEQPPLFVRKEDPHLTIYNETIPLLDTAVKQLNSIEGVISYKIRRELKDELLGKLEQLNGTRKQILYNDKTSRDSYDYVEPLPQERDSPKTEYDHNLEIQNIEYDNYLHVNHLLQYECNSFEDIYKLISKMVNDLSTKTTELTSGEEADDVKRVSRLMHNIVQVTQQLNNKWRGCTVGKPECAHSAFTDFVDNNPPMSIAQLSDASRKMNDEGFRSAAGFVSGVVGKKAKNVGNTVVDVGKQCVDGVCTYARNYFGKNAEEPNYDGGRHKKTKKHIKKHIKKRRITPKRK
jgi:hypothetical protein